MSRSEFKRWLAADVAAAAVLLVAVVLATALGPEWVGGAIALALVPITFMGIVITLAVQSRRRDPSSPRAIHAHPAPQNDLAAAPTNKGHARTVPSAVRAARPDVVTAYVDLAWLTHDACMHTYEATRPGR